MRIPAALILCFALLLSACGVKAPPIAPEEKPADLRKLSCSPLEPDCDVRDPKYKPQGTKN